MARVLGTGSRRQEVTHAVFKVLRKDWQIIGLVYRDLNAANPEKGLRSLEKYKYGNFEKQTASLIIGKFPRTVMKYLMALAWPDLRHFSDSI